jgi:hypothetical protein
VSGLHSRIACLLHPYSLIALIVLIANDRYLKAHWPGFLSGKLSDFSGMFLFPVFLFATWSLFGLRRSRGAVLGAIVVSDFVFVAVKTWPLATDAYLYLLASLGLPSHLVRDWTDLSALLMNAPAYLHLRSFVNSVE